MERKVKQVIVIRKDLKMRRGKEVAQACHSAMAFLTIRILKSLIYENNSCTVDLNEVERYWILNSFRKIGCKVDSLEDLMKIKQLCDEVEIECHVIEDNGVTEFNGVKTITALAIGPDYDERIDPITSQIPSLGLY